MKTNRKIIAALIAIMTNMSIMTAQDLEPAINTSTYNTAIGLRGGETSGLTIKHFVSDRSAIEGILGVWNRGFSATVLLERHQSAFNVTGMNWYYGFGGHASFVGGRYIWYDNGRRYARYYDSDMALGVDGVIGLEYKIPKAPFALSLDMKPYIEVISNGNIWMSIDPGLGIKVTF